MNLYQAGGKIDGSISFPSNWNELTLKQLHLIAKFTLGQFTDEAQAKAGLFLALLMECAGKKVKHIERKLDPEDVVINGLPAIEFITKENGLTKQPYPKLRLRFSLKSFAQTVYGPQDDFNNLTCGEFEDAEIYFHEHLADPGALPLANLAAILYRPWWAKKYLKKNWFTGLWTNYQSEKLTRRFCKVPAWKLYSIFLWYAGCREQTIKLFPEVFDGGSADKGEPDPMAFTNCIHHAAGEKNGSRNDIRSTVLKEFLHEMKLQKLENDRQREEIERHAR